MIPSKAKCGRALGALMSLFSALGLFFSALAPASPLARNSGKKASSEEETLGKVKLPTDNPGLLALLHRSAGGDQGLKNVDRLVRQLGDSAFPNRAAAERELIALGAAALPILRKNVSNSDTEVARRVNACIQAIERQNDVNWSLAAVRLLNQRQPQGTLEALLAYLPFTRDSKVEEEIYYALDSLAVSEGRLHSALVAALTDPLPARRAVAACIIGRQGSPEHRTRVGRMAREDQAPYVRLRAAQGLLAASNVMAVPTLIDLLKTPSLEITWQAEELLRWTAGDRSPSAFIGKATEAERETCHRAWQAWWGKSQDRYRNGQLEFPPGGPHLVLVWDTPQRRPHETEDRIWLAGSGNAPRYEVFFRKWVLLPRRDLEIIRRVTGLDFDREGNAVQQTGTQALSSDVGNGGEFRREYALRHGRRLRIAAEPAVDPNFRVVREEDEQGRVLWEAVPDGFLKGFYPVYPLVNFGFSSLKREEETIDLPKYRSSGLQSPKPLVRLYSLERLKKAPLEEDLFRFLLKTIDEDKEPRVRQKALAVLAASPSRSGEALPRLLHLLDKEDGHLQAALGKVFKATSTNVAIPILRKVLEASEPRSGPTRRANALSILIHGFTSERSDLDRVIEQAFRDPEPLIRKTVIQGLTIHPRVTEFLPDLIRAFNDPAPEVGTAAIRSLASLKDAPERAVTDLLALVNKEPYRRHVLVAFSKLGLKDPRVLRTLIDSLVSDDPHIINAATVALGERGPNAASAVKPLCRLLDKEWKPRFLDRHVKSTVIHTLGAVGREAKDAIPTLQRLLDEWAGPDDAGRILASLKAIDARAFDEAKARWANRVKSIKGFGKN